MPTASTPCSHGAPPGHHDSHFLILLAYDLVILCLFRDYSFNHTVLYTLFAGRRKGLCGRG